MTEADAINNLAEAVREAGKVIADAIRESPVSPRLPPMSPPRRKAAMSVLVEDLLTSAVDGCVHGTLTQLACRTGLAQVTVDKLVKVLQEFHLVESKYRELVIPDAELLAAFSQERST